MSLALDRQMKRWYPLIPHPIQLELIRDDVRFKLVPAGRRSGKTERAKRYLVKKAMSEAGRFFFAAAPTRDQARKIFWDDLKTLSLTSTHPEQPRETELKITFPNGSEIQVLGLDNPARIEGSLWHGGVIDEIADCKPDAWAFHVQPALDTVHPLDPGYRAWCWLTGVPDGLNHYYDLCQYARNSGDPDWKIYHWPSSDILPAGVIDAAKRSMSARQFKQEYQASFETASGRIYPDYSRDNHTEGTIEPHERLLWFHDFNYTPMSSGVGVIRNGDYYLLDEIILQSAVARESALEFVEKYRDHQNKNVVIYGDPAGRAGEKHGHASDYTEINRVVRGAGWTVTQKVKRAAPAIKDRQNAVRALIRNAAGGISLFVNPKNAPYCDKGLATVQLKNGSSFLEADGEYQHITTGVGYMADMERPVTPPATRLNVRITR